MSLSLDVEYGVLAKQNLGNGYVNAIKLSSNLEKIVSAINDISSAVKTNIVVRSVNDLLPLNETNDINLNILRPDKNETDVYKEILSSASLFMLESSEVSFLATEIGKKELLAGKNKIQSILVDDNKILAGSGGNGIFYSEDNGETFEQATGLEGEYVKVIKKFFGKYFAGTGNSVYQSTDGKNWTIFTVKVSKNIYLIKESVNDLLQVKYGNRKILIVATDNGVVATTNSYAKKTLISGTAYALTKDDKDNVYFSANFSDNAYIYVISIEKINNYLTATDVKKTTEENSEIPNLAGFKFGSNVYDILIKDKTLFAAVLYTVENNSRIRSITTNYGIKKAPLSDLSLQSFTSILGIGLQISYLKTNGYGIYTQIKNGSYPTFWFTTNGLDFTSYQTELNDDISEFDFIDNFTMVAGANGGIVKFKQTADYIRDKLITEIDLLANNELLCTYINEQDIETYISANNYTSKEIAKLDKELSDRISSEIDYIKNNTLSSYELISTFTLDYISLGKNTYNNNANKLSNNVAIGKDVVVTEKDSIGLGQNISASGSNNIAIGNNLSTSNTNAIAIGYNLTSDPNAGEHSIAIGYDAVALCSDSIAIGRMISTETTSTTKIGAAFGNTITGDNAETIALELSAKIKDDDNATSESKAYITVNRFTKNTGTWSETKKEISLKGHTHVISDVIGLSNEFTSHNNKINYISSYVYTISNDVEKISVDLYSLSSQTSSISTLLCAEISDLSTDIDSQKVTAVTALNAYTKDGASSSDTVKFPTAAAITLWADNKYAVKADIESLSTLLGLVKNDLLKTQGLVYEVYIAPNNTDNFIKNDVDFNKYLRDNGNISAGNDSNYEELLKIALSSIDAKTVYDYYKNEKDGLLHSLELSIPFLETLSGNLSALTSITTTDIETFRTHRLRLFPLFTLTRACDFLANFRAKGNTSYFINCVPGTYYYPEVQRIQNPDCSLLSRNLLTICRIDSPRYPSNGRNYSYTFKNYNKDYNGNFNFEKCIEFNFYKRLLYIFESKISDYPALISIYCYTLLQNIRVSSGLNHQEILNRINNNKLDFGDEFTEYTRYTYTTEDANKNKITHVGLSGYIPAGNAISSNTVIENNISKVKDIVYRPSNSADGTLKYTYHYDENGKNKYVTRYFKTYGLFIYSTDVELDFVCFDRLSHGFNTLHSNVTTWSIKFVGCAMGINSLLQSSVNFYFKLRQNNIRGACIIDIGLLGFLCLVNDNSYINFNYIPEVIEYTTNPPTGVDPNKVGTDLSCTPKYVFKGAFVDRGFYNFTRPNCGIFKLRANSTNTVTDGAGLNGLTRETVFNAGTDIKDLSVISLRFNGVGILHDGLLISSLSATISSMISSGTISSTDGYIFRKFYDALFENALALAAENATKLSAENASALCALALSTKLSASTERYFMFYNIGDDNGYRAPIFHGEDYKDVYLRKLFNGETIASSDFYKYTYDAMYYQMNAIHAVPSAPLAL